MNSVSASRAIAGHPTTLLIQPHADAVVVVVSQLDKVGSLIHVSIPPTAPLLAAPPPSQDDPNPLPPPSPAVNISYLLGHAPSEHLHTLYSLYAAQVAAIIWTMEADSPIQVSRRSVIFGISLKKTDNDSSAEADRRLFLEVMQMLSELLRSAPL